MIKLEDFQKLGIPITWKLIDIGFKGSEMFANQLLPSDILDYATDKMSGNDENTDLFDLACEYETNIWEIDRYVKKLSSMENSKTDIEFKKWRVVYVLKNLPDIDTEFIQGLIDLGDIWVEFDFPEDSPHIFQGRNNCITPQQYYTLDNYYDLLLRHQNWAKNEIEQIIGLSK
jgi:hypothetical protein